MIKLIKNITLQNYLWTILSAGINSVLPSFMIWICARALGVEGAGIISYAIAVSDLPKALILYGVRGFQATDVHNEFDFNVYLRLRVYTIAAALSAFAVFILASGITPVKTVLMAFWIMYVVIDSVSDVFEGELQRHNKMYLAGSIRFVRAFLAMLVFGMTILAIKILATAMVFIILTALVITAMGVFLNRNNFINYNKVIPHGEIKNLLLACAPIFLTQLLYIVYLNLPKYLISGLRTNAELAIYTIILMPSWLINLFSSFVFSGPELTKVAHYYREKEYSKLTKRVIMQFTFIAILSALLITLAFFEGIPFLSWMYKMNLSEYRLSLVITMCGGCFAAVCNLMGNVLVVIRKQKYYFAGYIVVVLLSGCTMPFIVSRWGVTGAAWSGVVYLPPLALYFFITYLSILKKNIAVEQD